MGMQYALNIGVFNATNERLIIVNDDNVLCKSWDVLLSGYLKTDDIVTIDQIEPENSIFNFHRFNCGVSSEYFSMDSFNLVTENYNIDIETANEEYFHI